MLSGLMLWDVVVIREEDARYSPARLMLRHGTLTIEFFACHLELITYYMVHIYALLTLNQQIHDIDLYQ
jgi:hypothetical protein